MIIDCHTHIYEQPSAERPGAADLVRELDAAAVDAAIVLPLPTMAGNSFVYDQCRRFPDRLFPLYTPEFEKPAETLRQMESFFLDHAPHGLKIHPRLQGVTIEQTLVREILAWAADRGLPVLFDAFPYGPSLGATATEPAAYLALARSMPDLQIVLAHAGGYKVLEAFLAVKAHPALHVDISFTPMYFRGSSAEQDLEFLCARLPAGRVLYGSDYPSMPMQPHLDAVRALTSALDEPRRAALFGGAAQTLFAIRR